MTNDMRTAPMFLRFLAVGGSGFLIDAGITHALVEASVASWLARIPAIATAMLYTWMVNRRFTYGARTQPTSREAFAYFTVALAMAVFNYGLYVVLVACTLFPVVAVAVATACQTAVSFFSYKRFVFGGSQ